MVCISMTEWTEKWVGTICPACEEEYKKKEDEAGVKVECGCSVIRSWRV